jgi:Ni,Fe-hydrogenase III small subunit
MQLFRFPEAKGHSYQYYPRGRVVIAHGKAAVYLNPNINTPDVQETVKKAFGLMPENKISAIAFRSDGSAHYQCHLYDDTIK